MQGFKEFITGTARQEFHLTLIEFAPQFMFCFGVAVPVLFDDIVFVSFFLITAQGGAIGFLGHGGQEIFIAYGSSYSIHFVSVKKGRHQNDGQPFSISIFSLQESGDGFVLDDTTTYLIKFYRFKQSAEIALAKTLVAFTLDDFKEDRANDCGRENLQQQFT